MHKWVRDERRRMAAAGSGLRSDPVGGEPLSVEERAELVWLRAQVAEQSKDITAKLASLAAGEAPFFEPGLDEVLRVNIDAGRLRFTSSYAEALEFADVHFFAAATPAKRALAADLAYVDSVVTTLAPLLRRPAVIYGNSTVPVGTCPVERHGSTHRADWRRRRSGPESRVVSSAMTFTARGRGGPERGHRFGCGEVLGA